MKNSVVFSAFAIAFLFAGVSFIYSYSTSDSKRTPNSSAIIKTVDFCTREAPGGDLAHPIDLYAKDGVLNVDLSYESLVADNSTRYCYMYSDKNGKRHQSPTLHVWPGETIRVTVTNNTRLVLNKNEVELQGASLPLPFKNTCKSNVLTPTSMNIHFHGTNVVPDCGSDEVIRTIINSGETFTYDIQIPKDEPPGLYFYHPHIHGTAESMAWGGATGAIIVEGIQNYFQELQGLSDRVFIIRDSEGPGDEEISSMGVQEEDQELVPAFNVSLNYHPVVINKYNRGKGIDYVVPKLKVRPNTKELWRVVNSSADAIVDIEVEFDGKEQPLTIYAIDAVPTNSHGGYTKAQPITRKHWTLAPGNRVEFTVNTPGPDVKKAQLVTEKFNTGADSDPARPLLDIVAVENAPNSKLTVGAVTEVAKAHRFTGIMRRIKSNLLGQKRKLYFAKQEDPARPEIPTEFYITVDDGKHKDQAFKLDRPVDITTYQEALEEWTIENRDDEAHVFHIHQIHFLLIGRNGVHLSSHDEERQTYDTIVIPRWEGEGHPYPSVTLRMDFHETPPGKFVFHCHILEHEDKGMMGIIDVLPRK